MLQLLIVLAIVFVLIGALTTAKWLLIVALVVVVAAVLSRNSRSF